MARAKSRIWRGLTTACGSCAAASAAATVTSMPPVASSTTKAGASSARRSTSRVSPVASRPTASTSPDGRRCTSSRSFATSIPTNTGAAEARSMTRPCACGLTGRRPKRLFGFESGRRAQTRARSPQAHTGSRPPPNSPRAASLATERYKARASSARATASRRNGIQPIMVTSLTHDRTPSPDRAPVVVPRASDRAAPRRPERLAFSPMRALDPAGSDAARQSACRQWPETPWCRKR